MVLRGNLTKPAVDSLRRQLRKLNQNADSRQFRSPQLGSALMPTAQLLFGNDNTYLTKPDSDHSTGGFATHSIYRMDTTGTPVDTTLNLTNVWNGCGYSLLSDNFAMVLEAEPDPDSPDYRYFAFPYELQDCETSVDIQAGTATTTDTTDGTLITYATATDTGYHVVANGLGINTDDYSEVGSYQRVATFRNDGGTLTLVSNNATHDGEDVSGWNMYLQASGTNIRFRCSGAASTNINWTGTIEIMSVQ